MRAEERPSKEYLLLLQYEDKLISTISQLHSYIKKAKSDKLHEISLIYIEHMYYKPDSLSRQNNVNANEKLLPSEILKSLFVPNNIKCILMYVYNLCINENYSEAKKVF